MKNSILTLFVILTIGKMGNTKEITAEEGLLKIEKNIAASQSNIDNFQENQTILNGNIASLNTTQNQMESQKKALQNNHKDNERILSNHTKEVAKIDGLINKEKNILEDERLKIQKLEALLTQLKSQKEQRGQNILELQASKDKFIRSKEKGIEDQKLILQSIQEVDKGIQQTKKELQSWNSKKKINERELAKWSNDKNKHIKMQDEIKVLMSN